MIKANKIKVLMVISSFQPQVGGAEKQCLTLAKKLRQFGLEIAILTRKINNYSPFEKIDEIPVYRKIKAVNLRIWGGLLYIISTFFFLLRNRNSYDIIHCHGLYHHTLVALLFKFLWGKKIITKILGTGPQGDLGILKNSPGGFISWYFIRKIDRLVTTSEEAIKELQNNNFPQEKVVKIPNGIDGRKFPYLNTQSNKKIITFVGRLQNKQKGIEDLIRSFIEIEKKHPDSHLLIVGDGQQRAELEGLVASSMLRAKVTFTGYVEDPMEYYAKTQVLVQPSWAEGLSNVLLEAMACGLPIVATAIGGNVELIKDNETGLLVPPRNPQALAKAVIRLLEDRKFAQRLGKNARKRIEKNYEIDMIASKYTELYADLLQGSILFNPRGNLSGGIS